MKRSTVPQQQGQDLRHQLRKRGTGLAKNPLDGEFQHVLNLLHLRANAALLQANVPQALQRQLGQLITTACADRDRALEDKFRKDLQREDGERRMLVGGLAVLGQELKRVQLGITGKSASIEFLKKRQAELLKKIDREGARLKRQTYADPSRSPAERLRARRQLRATNRSRSLIDRYDELLRRIEQCRVALSPFSKVRGRQVTTLRKLCGRLKTEVKKVPANVEAYLARRRTRRKASIKRQIKKSRKKVSRS
jgi:hypothetical protein